MGLASVQDGYGVGGGVGAGCAWRDVGVGGGRALVVVGKVSGRVRRV